jgi:ABC-type uncharacterized transport systems, ATPase components
VAFIPEDRTTEGLIPSLTLTENVVLGSRHDDPWIRRGRVDWKVARAHTASLLREFGVSASGPDAPAATLSGGNQQKVVVGRELARQPRVVVAENPTRGLDLRATEAIHGRLREAAATARRCWCTRAISMRCSRSPAACWLRRGAPSARCRPAPAARASGSSW